MIRTLSERIRGALPDGTLSVGTGLLVSGLTAYGFLVVSGRALGPEKYAPLSVLWTLVFLVAPGFFLPLEQELGRRIAEGRGTGTRDPSIVRRIVIAGAVLIGGLVAVSLLVSASILDRLLDDQGLLLIALIASFVTYGSAFLVRGALAGHGRFGHYGLVLGGEGVLRLAACAALVYLGVSSAGPYGLAVGLAPVVALAVLPVRSRDGAGRPASTGGLSLALTYLLVSSVFAQILINAGPIAVKLLATDAQGAEAGRFLAGLVMARIPLFLFQAVQAALLPKLARLAAAEMRREFQRVLERILIVVAVIAVATTAGAYVIGPAALRLLFGPEFVLGGDDLALLAGASSLCMAAIALSQAMVALGGHARVVWGWMGGVAAFAVVTALGSDLLLRVELGFLAGAAMATVVMGGLTALKLSQLGSSRASVRFLAPKYARTS